MKTIVVALTLVLATLAAGVGIAAAVAHQAAACGAIDACQR